MLLALGGTLFTLSVIEAGFRLVPLVDRWTGADFADRLRRSAARTPERGTGTDLAGLIRSSPNPEVVYELKPGLEATFQGQPVAINDHGMRDLERSVEKPDGTVRIVGIGDSIMFGWGVARDDTYLAVAERELARRVPGRRFEALNFAVPGYNTHLEVALFEHRVARFSPDLVVLHFVKNDYEVPQFLLRPPDPWALDRSYLWDFARGRFRAGLITVQNLGRVDGERRERILDGYRHMAGEGATRAALERLGEWAGSHAVPVVVLFGATRPGQGQMLEELATRHGFHLASIGPYVEAHFRERGIANDPAARREEFRVAPHDPHPNAVGHRVYADALLDRLVPLLSAR